MMSRNNIMARGGIGISNLQEITLTNGDMDIDQADALGIYKVNCNQQVGIATSTEVGLSYERYPIRVILTSNPAGINAFANETVCGYWRVVNASNMAVPFSRKSLASDLAIKNIYKLVPGLNEMLWDAYHHVSGGNYSTAHDPIIDSLNEGLYAILQLVAPTPEQAAEVPVTVNQIITACTVANRVSYFKIGDNTYILAEPHGKAYQPIGDMSAGRCALVETGLSVLINNQRLKNRYDTQSDGIVTLSSFAIAAMFRHGIFESFEHKEYYTLIMTPVAASPTQYTVHSIRVPPGAPALTDIALNSIIDIKDFKMKRRIVELANLMVISSGLMHYQFNHTTGGNVVSGTLRTILAMYQFVSPRMSTESQVNLTSLLYEALHPSNKRDVASLFFERPLREYFRLDLAHSYHGQIGWTIALTCAMVPDHTLAQTITQENPQ